MFLAVDIREEQDVRTAGSLLCLAADKMADISFAEGMEKLQLFSHETAGSISCFKTEYLRSDCGFYPESADRYSNFYEVTRFKGGLCTQKLMDPW